MPLSDEDKAEIAGLIAESLKTQDEKLTKALKAVKTEGAKATEEVASGLKEALEALTAKVDAAGKAKGGAGTEGGAAGGEGDGGADNAAILAKFAAKEKALRDEIEAVRKAAADKEAAAEAKALGSAVLEGLVKHVGADAARIVVPHVLGLVQKGEDGPFMEFKGEYDQTERLPLDKGIDRWFESTGKALLPPKQTAGEGGPSGSGGTRGPGPKAGSATKDDIAAAVSGWFGGGR